MGRSGLDSFRVPSDSRGAERNILVENRVKGFGLRAAIFSMMVPVWMLASSVAFAQQTGSGMKGYWKGDDGTSPTSAADSSGSLFNGTYQSGATTSSSVPTLLFTDPTSLSFNGTNSYVDIPSFSLDGTGPVTIAFWNLVATANVKNSSAFSFGNQDQPNRCQAHAPWSDKVLYWDYGDANNNSGRVSTNYASYLDKWTHVVLVSTGSGGAFQGIYLNGTLAVSSTTPKGPTVTFTGANLGAWKGVGLYHPGQLDDFRIYDRVLSAQEITALAAGNSGPAAPTGLAGAPGAGQITLTWNAAATATHYNVKRAPVSGGSPPGTYTTVATGLTATTFTDTGLTSGTTYYYIVSAVSFGEGPNSSELACQPSPIQISPPSLPVVEAGGTATVTVTLLAGLQAGQTVSIPISTSDATAGLVSVGAAAPATSTSLLFTNATGNVLSFTVTGADDFVAVNPKTFHIMFGTVSSGDPKYSNINYLPDVICNQIESDFPGVIVGPVSGPATNGGPPVTFTVQLSSIPSTSVVIPLGVGIPAGGTTQATVAGPSGLAQLMFTAGPTGNWNIAQTVVVTPLLIDTSTTYVTNFTITLGPASSGDSNYSGLAIPSVTIFEATSTPPLQQVWGNHCGLLGPETLALWVVLKVLRRKRRVT